MSDTEILIANYQSIIRVLSSQVKTLELQLYSSGHGCSLLPEECAALDDFITDELSSDNFRKHYGSAALSSLLSAWSKIREVNTDVSRL